MRIFQRYVILNADPALPGVLERAGITCDLETRQFGDQTSVTGEFRLYEDDPLFAGKREAVAPLGLLCQEGTEFSREEREAAEWHLLLAGAQGYPQPEHEWFERTYRPETACRTCGCAEEQDAPFRFKGEPKSRHSHLLSLHWALDAIFVRDAAKELLEREGVSGVRFSRPVLHRSGEPLGSIWQMEVPAVLLPGLQTGNVRLEPCDDSAGRPSAGEATRLAAGPFCQRQRFNFPTRGMITLRRAAFEGAPEVVRCREWFGSGGCSSRPIIVSRRVKRLIEGAGLRGASFTPVGLD